MKQAISSTTAKRIVSFLTDEDVLDNHTPAKLAWWVRRIAAEDMSKEEYDRKQLRHAQIRAAFKKGHEECDT